MKSIILPDENVRISGLPWYEHNSGQLLRLPFELESKSDKGLWDSVTEPSGVRYSFRSDATSMSLKVRYGSKHFIPRNNSIIGRAGIALRVDGDYWGFVFPFGEIEFVEPLFENVERKVREFTFYLPAYEVEILEIIIDDAATVESPTPYSIEKPVVFYGTSITQGGCASRCDLNYESRIGRMLNIDYVNLGFSGEGRGEMFIANAMTELDASCYVIDYGQNNKNTDEFENTYLPFIQAIRKVKKDTPIILTTLIFCVKESFSEAFKEKNEQKREIIRKAYNYCLDSGDKNIYLIEGYDLISPANSEYISDHTHPNDLGFLNMSTGIGSVIAEVLNIKK
jgi:hypothetical protein